MRHPIGSGSGVRHLELSPFYRYLCPNRENATRTHAAPQMETLSQLMIDWGYWGLFLSALIAGSILPFSSEAVMIVLVRLGLDPVLCVAAASAGNALGGMTCYWIGTLGRTEWIARLGVSTRQLARARRFLAGRGALMAFFAFLPTIGEAIAIVLGLMRSNPWLTAAAMLTGKTLRYVVILLTFEGAAALL